MPLQTSTASASAFSNLDPSVCLEESDLVWGEKVGKGSSSTVYRGACKGSDVAVKVLSARDWDNAFRELRVLQSVQHPNLLSLVGFALSPCLHRVYVATPFCEGGSAHDWLYESKSGLCWRQKEAAALDVARAVNYLHSFDPPIVHRDVKSSNLLLRDRVVSAQQLPEVVVADFGLAKVQESGLWSCMTKVTGTYQWMAPEVYTRDDYNEKVDIYSFGMFLYELICQVIPYQGDEAHDFPRRVQKGHRPDLRRIPEDCPELLRELMISCWAPNPGQRPDSAEVCGVLWEARRLGDPNVEDDGESDIE